MRFGQPSRRIQRFRWPKTDFLKPFLPIEGPFGQRLVSMFPLNLNPSVTGGGRQSQFASMLLSKRRYKSIEMIEIHFVKGDSLLTSINPYGKFGQQLTHFKDKQLKKLPIINTINNNKQNTINIGIIC